MSFFDEADEPPQRAPRSEPRRSRPAGRGRPPRDPTIQTRRTVAAVVVVVVVVLLALLVHSCDVSQRNSALKNYADDASSLIQKSDYTGSQLFHVLTSAHASTTAQNVQSVRTQLDQALLRARAELTQADGLGAPSQMQAAQQNLAQAMKMRRDGISQIARSIEPALGTTANQDAITQITVAMSLFYASDVLYKAYTASEIAGALNAAKIPVGGSTGQPINGGQFLPSLDWLSSSYTAGALGSKLPNSNKNTAAPGVHGHILNSVSVGSNTLAAGVTNTVPASPTPTFTLNLTNGGQFNQFNVGCKISVAALSDTGTATIAETTPSQTTTCSVKLPTAPTPGTYSVVATVGSVPGEKNTADNTMTFTVTFT